MSFIDTSSFEIARLYGVEVNAAVASAVFEGVDDVFTSRRLRATHGPVGSSLFASLRAREAARPAKRPARLFN
jgi:hypothetical protein